MTNWQKQIIPILLTFITFLTLCFLLFLFIRGLNLFPINDKIIPHLNITDVLVGLTIYLKTSVDFAIFIGNLMVKNSGMKDRIAIETGTAFGNALGTFFILFLWTFFKEIPILMIFMILLAALVLFRMGEDGLLEYLENGKKSFLIFFIGLVLKFLKPINFVFRPLVGLFLPKNKTVYSKKTTFFQLFAFAVSIPLILGLDDFAGYIPLFNIINVFGFAVGVFLGHMILNAALFVSPSTTIKIVRKPFIVLAGSVAFLGIGLWGIWEIIGLIIRVFF
ncbi:MAG TPA: hypothetical protein VF189_04605 [Patescibacteria group bacterium]